MIGSPRQLLERMPPFVSADEFKGFASGVILIALFVLTVLRPKPVPISEIPAPPIPVVLLPREPLVLVPSAPMVLVPLGMPVVLSPSSETGLKNGT